MCPHWTNTAHSSSARRRREASPEAIENFLEGIPAGALAGIKAAAFDTRVAARDHGMLVRLLIHSIGYAASRITQLLKKKGAQLIAPPAGFIVENKKGPLKAGELERAGAWAQGLAEAIGGRE